MPGMTEWEKQQYEKASAPGGFSPGRHQLQLTENMIAFLFDNMLPDEFLDDTVRRLAGLPLLLRRTMRGRHVQETSAAYKGQQTMYLRDETFDFIKAQRLPHESFADTVRRLVGMSEHERAGRRAMVRKTDTHQVLLTSETTNKLVRIDSSSVDAAIRKVLGMQPAAAPWEFTWHRESVNTYRLNGYAISLEAFSRLDSMAGNYPNDDFLRSLLGLPLFGQSVGIRRKLTPRGKTKETKRFPYDA